VDFKSSGGMGGGAGRNDQNTAGRRGGANFLYRESRLEVNCILLASFCDYFFVHHPI